MGPGLATYQTSLGSALGLPAAAAWTPGDPAPARGNLVFFNGLAHVALSTGNVVGGKAEVMSLWILPGSSATTFNSSVQRTTIEDIVAGVSTVFPRYGVATAMAIKHGPNPWR